jgi:phosphotransferase system enzyme I (PtsI)
MAKKAEPESAGVPRAASAGRETAANDAPRKERVFRGLGVAPGVVVGFAHLRESGTIDIPEYRIAEDKIDDERARFHDGVVRASRQVHRLRRRAETLSGAAAEELGYLLDAYEHMLRGSRLVRGVEQRITEQRVNAEAAVQAELTELTASFAAMDDAYLAARLDDIREVAMRLIRSLMKTHFRPLSTLPEGSVIIAEELSPADTAQMDPKRVRGFATVLGGAEGHTAIMARALGLPAVVGAASILRAVRNGDQVVVDGDRGVVVVDPGTDTLADAVRRREERERETKQLAQIRRLAPLTRDGAHITLQANVELPIEMEMVRKVGAEGIGLLRSEFMFMNREDLPSEDEQYETFKEVIGKLEGRPATIRTLDIGGEKIAPSLAEEIGDSITSALGLRGIRLSLSRSEVLEAQFAAILRAGAHGPVRVLLPMVSTVSEVRRAREILKKVWRRLRRRRVPVADELPPLGVMIEVPGAALAADALALNCDFFAIGSNDLTMYTLAIDRSDEQVAELYNPLHPAVLRLIHFASAAALRARIGLSICGEMAGDPRFTALLVGLGFRELSMAAPNIPRVKKRVRALDLVEASRRAAVVMEQVDTGRIAMLLDDFNGLAS